MKIRILPLVSALAISAFASNAMAFDVRLDIEGELVDTTCKIEQSEGPLNRVVKLETISANALVDAGSWAGRQSIELQVSDCSHEGGLLAFFETGDMNVTPDGLLENLAEENAAENVQVQILDKDLNPMNLWTDRILFDVDPSTGNGLIEMKAQYFSTEGRATAGVLSTFVEMTLGYQ